MAVDRSACVCRMRISVEGRTAEAGSSENGNCLKVLKKTNFKFL
ncbi:hypothetical protein SAMN04488490_2496 [Marinobacter sp. LV10R510-11A]|nr:hypothetical protein SAMN04488490_2496 [Marinobacter sp. LV10R510-11A]